MLDLAQYPSGRTGGDGEGLDVMRDDAVGADHAALADRDATGDDDANAQPAVVADACGPLAVEALPGDWLVGVVEAMVGVGYEAAVGQHAVLAYLHEILGGDHHAAVEEAAGADLDARLPRCGDPHAGLQQHPLPQLEPALPQGLEHVALQRPAREGPLAHQLPVDAHAVPGQGVALIPAPLLAPQLD